MKKRVLALLLCLSMTMGMVPAQALEVGQDDQPQALTLQMEDEVVETMELPENDKVTLTAEPEDADMYQWQILAVPELDLWVDIMGQTEYQCSLSYPMISNLLDEDKSVQVRCKSVLNDETVMSDPVVVVVTDPIELEPQPMEPSEPVIEIPEEVIPGGAEPSEEPVETPSTEPSEEPVETPSTEPSEEPVVTPSTEPSEEPVETPSEEPSAPVETEIPEETVPGASEPEQTTIPAVARAFAFRPMVGRDGEDLDSYNVIINYQFENGEMATESYTATLAAGSNFSTTVNFPQIQGYLPYVDDVQQNSIDLNYTNIQENHTITVVYKPTLVEYTVIHYQQNVDDDKYTEVDREILQGLTNDQVPESANTYEGFYALLYERPYIAADGSTVVEIYYDRVYSLMLFELDGGYGVEPIYARYGTPIGDVGTPVKAGYTFTGWNPELPAEMPADNTTCTAQWVAEDLAKVSVVIWGENADDEEYSYIQSSEVYVKPDTQFTYTPNGALICAIPEHTHTAACGYACGLEEHRHDASCYTLTCPLPEHTHDVSCYPGAGNAAETPWFADPTGNGYVYEKMLIGRPKVIYINGNWYEYNGNASSGDIVQPNCGMQEHTHTDYTGSCYSLTCNKPVHTHSDACGYLCGQIAHQHTADCYMSGAGQDSSLWTFVRSDTVIVAADGSSVVNVYYDRTEKTLTFNYNYSDRQGYRAKEEITAKWGSDISEQYVQIANHAESTFWTENYNGQGPYTNYIGIMPQKDIIYYHRSDEGSQGTMTYWGQDLNGQYTVKLFEISGVGGYTVTDEDRYEFEGFTYHHGTQNGQSCKGATFYYTRNSYDLVFNDGYNDVKTEIVKYEAPLNAYNQYVPEVPAAYEPNSVTFGGWYLNPECSGEEFKLDEHTMPADNIILYAKWVPVSHTVKFYLDKNAYEQGTTLDGYPEREVPHGTMMGKITDPVNGSYSFVGWFYMENGEEKAFDPENMPVNKDLDLYGKWSSNVLKEYTIYYKIEGTDTQVAEPTTGSGLAGITKTFEAKGGTELYPEYQEGYFPVVKSHSIPLDIENDQNNTFTFWYVQKEAVPYTVKYLNKETQEPVAPEKKVDDNRKAVVTENFVTVKGMMPDAYQKRLVVSAEEGAVNEIIFWYTEDTTHAYYQIVHYTENLEPGSDGKPTWTEYASSQLVGDIGTEYTAESLTIPGFTYNEELSYAKGELTADGLQLKLYYTRDSYPYEVRYLEQGTNKVLHDPTSASEKYGKVISEKAIDIANYEIVGDATKAITIQIDEETPTKNIITFYYKEKEATIQYQVIGPDGCGTVSLAEETLKVLSGKAQGSTPTETEDFRFVGWFTDEDCTEPVNAEWVNSETQKLTPQQNADGVYETATYYAKFEINSFDLTITKTIDGDAQPKQSFIFDVTDNSGNVFTTVVLYPDDFSSGTASVIIKDVPGGTYTVTERTDWSWMYRLTSENAQEVSISKPDASFTNGDSGSNWIGGTAKEENRFDVVQANEPGTLMRMGYALPAKPSVPKDTDDDGEKKDPKQEPEPEETPEEGVSGNEI